jgi:TetR/AcrR family transcriptional regulator, cholesterol catabolism regulator
MYTQSAPMSFPLAESETKAHYKKEQCSFMQTQKENIRLELVRAARKAFLKHGFKDTSMRAIAREAGVGLSNIYNYFQSKDQLFEEILVPAIQAFERVLEEHNSEANLTLDIFTSRRYLEEHVRMITELIVQHREALRLLFFNAHGSALEGFKEALIERHTQIGLESLRLMKERSPEINIDVSNFFIHTMSSWWFSTLSEMVMHELSREELERFITEYMEYGIAGWKQIMKVR